MGSLGTQIESLTRRVYQYLLLGTGLDSRAIGLQLNDAYLSVTPYHIKMAILKEH